MRLIKNQTNSNSDLLDWTEALDYLMDLQGFVLTIERYWKGTLEPLEHIDLSHLWCLNQNHSKAKDAITLDSCPSSQFFKIQH